MKARSILALFAVSLLIPLHVRAADVDAEAVGALLEGVTEEALRERIEALAAFGSRVPGYAGHDRAAAYVRESFATLGYTDIKEDAFPVTVPLDEGSSLEVVATGKRFALHALWPNLVRTSQLPADGVTGTAVDGGNGEWGALNGKRIAENIVFIDFNSEQRWLNSAMLGARAIVFVEPDRTTRRQAAAKVANVPLDVARFWISAVDYGELVKEGMGKEVRVKCRMPWRQVEGRNLLVRLEGTDPELRDKLVCIQAYYDSMSVVPALAPGAEAACGMAAMLEIARVLKANPPKCSVLFLATSGHYLWHEGIYDFMHRHARRRQPFADETADPILPDLLLALDLSSKNMTVGVTIDDGAHSALMQSELRLYNREFLRHADLLRSYAEAMGGVLGAAKDDLCLNLIRPDGGGSWRAYLPESISLAGTIALMGATPALSLVTVHDPRLALDTPLDLPDGVDYGNLRQQTRFLAAAMLLGLDSPELVDPPKMREDRLRLFRGRLVTFDPRKSFMPDDPVAGGIGRLCPVGVNKASGAASALGIRRQRLAITDDDGWFEIREVIGGGIEGYDLDPDTGQIIKAVDLGLEGAAQYPTDFKFDTFVKERTTVLFNCRSTDLYDIVDPRYLIPMDKLLFFDRGNVEPFAYGYCLNPRSRTERSSDADPYASVFTKPAIPLKIGVSSDILGQRMLFLNAPNANTRQDSEGLGYDVGKIRLIDSAPFRVLRDMHYLNAFRMGVVRKYGIENRRLERLHAAGSEALKKAEEAAAALEWDAFIRYARRGLGIESRAYPDVTATADDVVKGIVFYMALLIPFAFFCERLFFGYTDLKRRIITVVLFFLLAYAVLRVVHPAFKIVETAEVILLGLIILTLCGIVVSISTGRFEAQMRTMKQQRGKVHYTDVSRASATATAFALGVSNMRRRKVRTLLTCIAIILLMFTVLSFTSVKTYLRPRKIPRVNAPAYQGALIRDRTWVPMKFLALEHLASEFGDIGVLARRSWLSPKTISEEFTQLSIMLRPVRDDGFGEERIRAFGLVGLDAAEAGVSGIDSTLKAGRWFEPGERDACILPDSMAEALAIGPEDVGTARVHLMGLTVTVVGIADTDRYNDFVDLDNERLTPIDFTMLSREALARTTAAGGDVSQLEGRAALETFVHVDSRNAVLLPYETVLDMGGALQSVAVKFTSGTVSEHVERLLDRLAVTVFVGEGDRVMVYSSLASSSIGGMANILVPVLIAALMVLNTMSGSVHERLREIGTYSSVGLAPSHIGALFLAEACVYAILGGIAGYVIGQVVTKALGALGLLQGLTLNYSSLASVLATVIVMVTVILSTVYPARMASRLAVPDVTRKWVLPDPEGDVWDFDFPFTVGGREVKGLYVFFRYYFASFEEQSVGRFYTTTTELSSFTPEGSDVTGYRLQMRVWLAPFDLGVSQDVDMQALPTGDFGVYAIRLSIRRLSGQSTTWVRINRGFLNEIRKQFLLWRTIPQDSKAEYTSEGEDVFA